MKLVSRTCLLFNVFVRLWISQGHFHAAAVSTQQYLTHAYAVLERHYGHFVMPPHVNPWWCNWCLSDIHKRTLGKAMFSHVCTPCNVPDEKFFRNTYQQVLVYEGLGLNQGTGFEILKGKDTSITRRLSEAHLPL